MKSSLVILLMNFKTINEIMNYADIGKNIAPQIGRGNQKEENKNNKKSIVRLRFLFSRLCSICYEMLKNGYCAQVAYFI